jgi:hypothetical protein
MRNSLKMSHISLIVLYGVVPVCCLHQHLFFIPETLLQQLEIVRSVLNGTSSPHLQTLSYCSSSWLAATRFLKQLLRQSKHLVNSS